MQGHAHAETHHTHIGAHSRTDALTRTHAKAIADTHHAHVGAHAHVPNATTSTARSVMHAFCLRSAAGDLSCAQNAAIAAAWSEEDAVAGEHLPHRRTTVRI